MSHRNKLFLDSNSEGSAREGSGGALEFAWIVVLIFQPLSLGEGIVSFLLLPHLPLAPSLYFSPLFFLFERVLALLRLNRFHYCCDYRPPFSTNFASPYLYP